MKRTIDDAINEFCRKTHLYTVADELLTKGPRMVKEFGRRCAYSVLKKETKELLPLLKERNDAGAYAWFINAMELERHIRPVSDAKEFMAGMYEAFDAGLVGKDERIGKGKPRTTKSKA